ncbi:MAG TPA: NTP transferase domain-containing protein, partial [Thermoanaerobaculia bacterium]
GVLLAAGTSSRMGSNKLLFELEGESLVRRAARRALEAGLSPLLVVLGHDAERTERELQDLPCVVVLNRDYETGITSSLQSGVAALPAAARAVVVMLAVMPFVRRDAGRPRRALAGGRGAARHLRLRGGQRPAHALRPRALR